MKEEKKILDLPKDLKTLEELVKRYGGGVFEMNVRIPEQLQHLAENSLLNFFKLPLAVQLEVLRSYDVRGKFDARKSKTSGFVFQMTKGGTQQIKEYKPELYKNNVNTPLRSRSRTIVHLALQEPYEKRAEKMRELYRSYPYYLVKDLPINLRLKNFYFDRYFKEGEKIKIYRLRDNIEGLALEPSLDILYAEKEYTPKKTVKFQYEYRDIEYYYGVNSENGEISNVLKFVWLDEMIELKTKFRRNNQ